jgi:hypothetical protein
LTRIYELYEDKDWKDLEAILQPIFIKFAKDVHLNAVSFMSIALVVRVDCLLAQTQTATALAIAQAVFEIYSRVEGLSILLNNASLANVCVLLTVVTHVLPFEESFLGGVAPRVFVPNRRLRRTYWTRRRQRQQRTTQFNTSRGHLQDLRIRENHICAELRGSCDHHEPRCLPASVLSRRGEHRQMCCCRFLVSQLHKYACCSGVVSLITDLCTCGIAGASPGALIDRWFNMDGSDISDMTSSTLYPWSPSARNVLLNVLQSPFNLTTSLGQRITCSFSPPVSGAYTYALSLSVWFI